MTFIPFAHPTEPQTRSHGPLGYVDYKSFKPWLRDEFAFRCVYCLVRERWYPNRADSFSVEHVLPQSTYPQLVVDYANLVYACITCNSFKRDQILLDPLTEPLGNHLRLENEGAYIALTVRGEDLIDALHLNDPDSLACRRKYLLFAQLHEALPDNPEVQALFRDAFGYPDDLPDLRELRPPGGNACPQGVHDCHFARREDGRLPVIY